jgi:uncharacterized repeat protein (TIGR03803 family)
MNCAVAKATQIAIVLSVLATMSLPAALGAMARERVLHSFGGADGANPYAGLVLDTAGNIYGTTDWGGKYGLGTVFELKRGADGSWSQKVLHSFGNGLDGQHPYGSLVFDSTGNLYGTTTAGGTDQSCRPDGCGTVFELFPLGEGVWAEKVLYNFTFNGIDGIVPDGNVIMDEAGNLYGTTVGGGPGLCGTVFELRSGGNGTWSEQVLYSFDPSIGDGCNSYAGLTRDPAGNLYGTTSAAGANQRGTVFEVSPDEGGWTEKVLYSFQANTTDGWNPNGGVIFDNAGNLYGTTLQGGGGDQLCSGFFSGCGTVFELRPDGLGNWQEKVIYAFRNKGGDGHTPSSGLAMDSFGNLFAILEDGGYPGLCWDYGCGAVAELSRGSDGTWTEKVLRDLGSTDGYYPLAALVLDKAGNIYGTTSEGGSLQGGAVFEILP